MCIFAFRECSTVSSGNVRAKQSWNFVCSTFTHLTASADLNGTVYGYYQYQINIVKSVVLSSLHPCYIIQRLYTSVDPIIPNQIQTSFTETMPPLISLVLYFFSKQRLSWSRLHLLQHLALHTSTITIYQHQTEKKISKNRSYLITILKS